MAFRIDYSTISFTSNHCMSRFHLGNHIHFPYSRSIVFATIFTGYIAQSTGRTQVRNGISGSMFQYIVCHGHQCIFFAIHFSILTDHSQTVNIRVYNESHVTTAFGHQSHNVPQVLFQRFRVMLKITGRFTIKLFYMLHSQPFQQFRKNNTAN